MTEQDILAAIRFDAAGLVPAIAQQHDTGEVLMLAWMNREAVAETLATGRVCYFSRSRNALWRKGETSGQAQHLKELRVDCDGDTLLLLVEQEGVACHTGRRNCFFRAVRDGALVEIAAPLVSTGNLVWRPRAWLNRPGHRADRLSRRRQDDAAEPSAAPARARRHRGAGQRVRRDRPRPPAGGEARREHRAAERRLPVLHGARRPGARAGASCCRASRAGEVAAW